MLEKTIKSLKKFLFEQVCYLCAKLQLILTITRRMTLITIDSYFHSNSTHYDSITTKIQTKKTITGIPVFIV